MKIVDATGRPCPFPVIEAKKALAESDANAVLIKVDNIVAVQNLEKMANGYGHGFSYVEIAKNAFDVIISKNKEEATTAVQKAEAAHGINGASENMEQKTQSAQKTETNTITAAPKEKTAQKAAPDICNCGGLVVVISRNTMGEGAEELGKILIKGFIYSLTELPVAPRCVIFLNSGAYLTAIGSNTVDDLKKLEQKGTEILTCGTCINYYNLQDKLAVGKIANMYDITERMSNAKTLINI